ncbi:MAG: hypothetical protein CR972_00240 [Candidatus Moraniibacteriota bacterium]|nr:MAG: hypothetical protein CR972_00240 [Candidatus Moranbacteria bacterium]
MKEETVQNKALSIMTQRASGYFLLSGLFFVTIAQLFMHNSLYIAVAEIVLLVFSVIFLYRLEWGVLLFIFLRPSIDRQAEYLSVGITDNFSLNIAAIFGVLIVVFSALYAVKYYREMKQISLKYQWIAFLLIFFGGIFYSIDSMQSFYEFIRMTSVFAIFSLIFLIVHNGVSYKKILYVILASAVIPFLVATYQIIFGTGLGTTPGVASRVFGTFSHPSPFALYTLTIAAISFFLIVTEEKKIWAYSAFVPSVIILISTFTRGSWIALVLFVSFVGLIKAPRFLFIGAVCAIILFFGSTTIHDRIEDIYNPPSDSSIRWRFGQWENMYDVALDKPVLGYGTGTEAIVHYYKFGFDAGNPYTHNDFLKVFVENGIVGFGAYILLVISTIIVLFIKYYQLPKSQLKDLCLVVLAIFSVFMLVSVGDNVLRSTATQWSLWSMIAICLSAQVARGKGTLTIKRTQ